VREKLTKILDDFAARRQWGSLEVVIRNGAITVIQKTESVRDTSYDKSNGTTRSSR